MPGVTGSQGEAGSRDEERERIESESAAGPRGHAAEAVGALAIVLATAALALGPRLVSRLAAHPSSADCESLLARYVELKERSVSPKLDAHSYEASLESARRLAGPDLSACRTEVTLDEADCARRANNADEFERCLR